MAPQANRAMMGNQDGDVEDDRIAARGDKLGVQAQAEELFEVLPYAVHLLGEVGLFARLLVGGLRGDHLGRGLIDWRGLGGGVRRRGLRLALRLEPNDGVQHVAVGGVERGLGIGVAHVALGADSFNFSRSSMTCPFVRWARRRAICPGASVAFGGLRCAAPPRPWSNSIVQVID